jgi:general secretion pathway protein K
MRLPKRRTRGFALLVVLWAVAMAALIGTEITALGRRETHIAANLKTAVMAEAAADGAVYEAIFRLMRGETGWDGKGEPHAVTVGQFQVTVTVRDEGGKVNLNDAPLPLLVALFAGARIDTAAAENIAAAVVAWRGDSQATAAQTAAWREQYRAAGLDYAPPFEPFQTVDELSLVLGMTPDFYAKVAPYITVSSAGGVNPDVAEPIVLAALQTSSATTPQTQPAANQQSTLSVVTIDARAAGPERAAFARRAIVNLGGSSSKYSIYEWSRGPP